MSIPCNIGFDPVFGRPFLPRGALNTTPFAGVSLEAKSKYKIIVLSGPYYPLTTLLLLLPLCRKPQPSSPAEYLWPITELVACHCRIHKYGKKILFQWEKAL